MSKAESDAELLARVLAEASANQKILKRSQQRELSLLNSVDLGDLLDYMTHGLRASFEVDQLSCILWDPQHEVRHLLNAARPDSSLPDDMSFVSALTGMSPLYDSLVRPWTGRYSASEHGLLIPPESAVSSVAIIPLRRQNRLIGSLNLGSRDALRFQRGQASDFLAHLGSIASFALENAVNRARLLRSGFTDVLTGWHNRRYLKTRLQDELARAGRDSQALACLMLDVDFFKSVNDNYGHLAGDEVLREITQRIEEQIRRSDIASRYGGEEFVILLPNTEQDVANVIAERIREAIAASPIAVSGAGEIDVTISIGLASIRPETQAGDLKTLADALLAEADVQLYRAKAGGRNSVSG